jgi:hypothetical protein
MAIGEGQFLEFEKRFAAFKHVFNTLQTSVHKSLLDESANGPFETSHQIYLDDLLTGTVRFSGAGTVGEDANIQPASHCGWQPATVGANTHDNALLGSKYTRDASDPTYPVYTSNPNVEKVTIPLYKAANSERQAYFAFQPPETAIDTGVISVDTDFNNNPDLDITDTIGAYQYGLSQPDIVNNADLRLRNWIAPTKFGKDYTVLVFQSNEDFTGPDTKKLKTTPENRKVNANFSANNVIHGGYIFDYYQGMMYLAPNKDNNDPDGNQYPYIAGLRHPLWLVGYRYNGPTGSDMTVTGAETSNTSDSSTGGGGVSTTLFSQIPGHTLAYDIDTPGWYDINTQTATDSEDIIEYLSPDSGLVISGSYGNQDLIVRLDSSSYNNITSTPWGQYSDNDAAIYNGGNLFAFASESTADYSSYALFRTTGSAGNPLWVTQSFVLSSPARLHQVGLCFSNNTAIDIVTDTSNALSNTYRYPAGYKLEGSTALNGTYEEIASVTNLRNTTIAGGVPGPIAGPHLNNFGENINNEYWADKDRSASGPIYIYCATASITKSTRYQYYRLYVSGGVDVGTPEDPQYVTALHHLDLWQNLDFGPTNRKQVNLKFNDQPTGRVSHITSEELSHFDIAVSASARKLGYTQVLGDQLVTFSEGEIPGDVQFGGEVEFTGLTRKRRIKGLTSITSSFISASTKLIAGELAAISMSGVGDNITFNDLTNLNTLTTKNLTVQETMNVLSSFSMPSDSFIYLTNKKVDGTSGVDEFSARIFGNYVDEAGVSDMYLDAYRIYTIADAKMHMRTLHPTLGTIVLQSPETHISGSLKVDNQTEMSGRLLISGSIIPSTSGTSLTSSFSLGSATAAWKDIHVSNGTIKFYDGTQERATIGLDSDNDIEFKSGNDFRAIKAKSVEFIPTGSTVSSVQISDDGQGFVAVNTNGKNSTVFRAEATLPVGERMGSITQKGTGSFAILLDADASVDPHPNAKFVVESNSPLIGIMGQRLFSVSESFETRVHNGGLRADKYVTTTNITASIISASATITANSFTGIFNGALSSSVQIATEISGAFYQSSHSLQNRVSNIESDTSGKTLISGSAQIATAISGAFTTTSASYSGRVTVLESFRVGIDTTINDVINEYHTPFSSSMTSRVNILEANEVFTTNAISGAFDQVSSSIQLRLTTLTSDLQPVITATSSYALINNDVLFNNITASNNISASNINVGIISASHLYTEIFNPANITTTVFSASSVNLGDLSNNRTFTTDGFNTIFASSTRPTLTVRNDGGSDVTYFGSPVDNADAFIEFKADRSNTTFTVGIDSHDETFKIAEGAYLNENSGRPPFSIKNNKVGILQSGDPTYELDVYGDIRSTGTIRVDAILGNSYPYTASITIPAISSSGTIIANAFVGDGTGLTGVATTGNVVLNSATASFLTEIPAGTYSSSLQTLGHITASGNISASGDINADNISITNDYSGRRYTSTAEGFYQNSVQMLKYSNGVVVGNTTGPDGTEVLGSNASGIKLTGNVSASGNISSSGIIESNGFHSTATYHAGTTRVIYNLGDSVFLGDTALSQKVQIQASNIILNAPVTASIISASGIITAVSYNGSLSTMTGTIDGGSF